MKNFINPFWISSYAQVIIKTPPIFPLHKESEKELLLNILKVKMRRNTESVALKTYEFKFTTFKTV